MMSCCAPTQAPPIGLLPLGMYSGGGTINSINNAQQQAAVKMSLPKAAGVVVALFEFPNVDYSTLQARQLVQLRGAYATILATPDCIGTDPTQVSDDAQHPNLVGIVGCPNLEGTTLCKKGTRVKALIKTSPGDTISDYGYRIVKSSCTGNYGAIFNVTRTALKPSAKEHVNSQINGASGRRLLFSTGDDPIDHVRYVIQNVQVYPGQIAPDPGVQAWNMQLWAGLIVAILLSVCGLVVVATLRTKDGLGLGLDSEDEFTSPGLEEDRGQEVVPLIGPPDDEETAPQLELPFRVDNSAVPFPEVGFAERNGFHRPLVCMPYPEVGYGTPVSRGAPGSLKLSMELAYPPGAQNSNSVQENEMQ